MVADDHDVLEISRAFLGIRIHESDEIDPVLGVLEGVWAIAWPTSPARTTTAFGETPRADARARGRCARERDETDRKAQNAKTLGK